jgi:NADH-quinone oxidoreductase subunit K
MVGLEHYLAVAAALFVIGIFGLFLNRKNVIVILMSIELMLLAVNINFIAFSSYLGDLVTVESGRSGAFSHQRVK